MGQAGREWAKRFSCDDAAREVWDISVEVAQAA